MLEYPCFSKDFSKKRSLIKISRPSDRKVARTQNFFCKKKKVILMICLLGSNEPKNVIQMSIWIDCMSKPKPHCNCK